MRSEIWERGKTFSSAFIVISQHKQSQTHTLLMRIETYLR